MTDWYDRNVSFDSDWFCSRAKSDTKDSTRGLFMLIEEQNRLIENQGKQQIALLTKILDKLEAMQ